MLAYFKALILPCLFVGLLLIAGSFFAGQAFAQQPVSQVPVVPAESSSMMLLSNILEVVIFVLFIASFIITLMIIKTIGPGVLNVVFYTFAAGILLVALSRLFLFLADNQYYYHL